MSPFKADQSCRNGCVMFDNSRVHALRCNKTCINSTVRNHEMKGKLAVEEKNIPHPRYKVELTQTLSILVHSQKRQTTGQNILELIMHRKLHHAAHMYVAKMFIKI